MFEHLSMTTQIGIGFFIGHFVTCFIQYMLDRRTTSLKSRVITLEKRLSSIEKSIK